MLNPARILIIAASLFVAGLLDAGASIPKTRVGNFLETAPVLTAPESVQVIDTRPENWSLYDEPASGSTVWTKFDPEGLRINKETHERVNKNGSKTKVTNITVTGKVDFQGQSAKQTQKQQQRIVDKIEKGIKKTFENVKGGGEVNISIDLKIADNGKNKITKDDNVFRIVDHVQKNDTQERKDGTVGYVDGLTSIPGGMASNIRFGGVDKRSFQETVAHEFGHQLNLMHPNKNDPNNSRVENDNPEFYHLGTQNPVNVSRGNIMRYGDGQAMAVDAAHKERTSQP